LASVAGEQASLVAGQGDCIEEIASSALLAVVASLALAAAKRTSLALALLLEVPDQAVRTAGVVINITTCTATHALDTLSTGHSKPWLTLGALPSMVTHFAVLPTGLALPVFHKEASHASGASGRRALLAVR
jgi:hypothetical protein